ncbi:hypothetical protein ACFXD5_19795 [Streptomyces sp. NPDC059385]|uniref:hypothetical protein n=1 Tax=Streptomyces sp. NPDC059385 TaxID=3346817 RepID=UPI0036B383C3
MGYVPKHKIYRLLFEDAEMDGLVVRVHGLSTGQYIDLMGLKQEAESGGESGELFQYLADRLVEWNVEEEDGTPVPANLDGIRAQDMPFTMAIINAWTKAMADVPAPLAPSSTGGESSLEASIPMEVLSPSLAS